MKSEAVEGGGGGGLLRGGILGLNICRGWSEARKGGSGSPTSRRVIYLANGPSGWHLCVSPPRKGGGSREAYTRGDRARARGIYTGWQGDNREGIQRGW